MIGVAAAAEITLCESIIVEEVLIVYRSVWMGTVEVLVEEEVVGVVFKSSSY